MILGRPKSRKGQFFCESAEPAADFVVDELRPSLNACEALDAAGAEVFFVLTGSQPTATVAAVATLDLGRMLRDARRASKLLFSDDLDAATLAALHPLLGDESFRVFLELLAPRIRPPSAMMPVAVLAAGADAMFTAEETRLTAAAWGTRPIVFDGMGHDMMLAPGWEGVARQVSWRASDMVVSA